MLNPNKLGKEVMDTANDQLENLKAVKGEGFAIMVAELLQMRSVGTIIGHALDRTNPMSLLAMATLSELQARYMTLVQDKAGLSGQSDIIEECVEWSERIHDSTKRVVTAAMGMDDSPDKDSLH